jgi:uncharacterized NAD-dependent epimerase/dehydratase family protein
MGKRFQNIVNRVTGRPEKKRCAVVCPDEGTVRAALKAEEMGLVDPFFFFDESRREVLKGLSVLQERKDAYLVVELPEEAAKIAVQRVRGRELDMLLKGNIDTAFRDGCSVTNTLHREVTT